VADGRRSSVVSLSIFGLIGTVWAADKVIPQGTEMRRNLYGDLATCEAAYPPPPNRCEQSTQTGSGGHAFYGGPYYSAYRGNAPVADPGPGRAGVAPASYETSTRGGFGAFGRAVHAAA
jgi:hypothetical protein